MKDVAEIKFCLATPDTKGETSARTVLSPSKLADKTILDLTDESKYEFENSKYKVDDDANITTDTIIIKRICPLGVMYVENVGPDIYASGNMILIKTKDLDSKYLASVLDREIPTIMKEMEGTRLPALNRRVIDDIEIPKLEKSKQVAIGKIWFNNYILYDLRKKAIKLEKEATDAMINKYTNKQGE